MVIAWRGFRFGSTMLVDGSERGVSLVKAYEQRSASRQTLWIYGSQVARWQKI